MPKHNVEQGETLESIARKYKLKDWKAIYDHADNEWFKDQCEEGKRNPSILHPGECFCYPSRELAEAPRSVDRRHLFKTPPMPKTKLRLVLGLEPLAGVDWNLTCAFDRKRKVYRGRTGGRGLIEVDVDVGAQKAKLEIGERTWDLQIGYLNPLNKTVRDEGLSGAQGRLLNLGVDPGPIDGISGPKTKAALTELQKAFPEDLESEGTLDKKTRGKLAEVHGC